MKCTLIALLYWASAGAAAELTHVMRMPRDLGFPGTLAGEVTSRWVSPYVMEQTITIRSNVTRVFTEKSDGTIKRKTEGIHSESSYRWLAPDGREKKELGGRDEARWGFVLDTGFVMDYRRSDHMVAHALNGTWTIKLRPRKAFSGSIKSTPDSRFLVRECDLGASRLKEFEFYVDGKWAGILGPLLDYQGFDFSLNSDGSFSWVGRETARDLSPTVWVTRNDGRLSFKQRCDRPMMTVATAPEGQGVLLAPLEGGHPVFTYCRRDGRTRPVRTGFNPRFIAWDKNSGRALFQTSVGYDHSYELIDCDSGQKVWEIVDPASGHVERGAAMTIADGHVFLGGGEWVTNNFTTGPVSTIYALEVDQGKIVARWRHPNPAQDAAPVDGRFVKENGRLYWMGGRDFAEINLSDAWKHKNGWE
ncbi:MAG TPA: hypothetical protein VHH73_14425 [Verrucomicrobiae bacterium]|nr:hypothetical protein [Verrucomicrobiae bacterium]